MITPILERLILQSKAEYKVHNHNFSNYGILRVAKKSTVIITDIAFHPFINVDDETINNYRDVMNFYNTTQLCLRSQSKQTFYHFKNYLDITVLKQFTGAIPIEDLFGASNNAFIQPKPPVKIDTFLINTQDINIEVIRTVSVKNAYEPVNDGIFSMATIPENTNEPLYPRGLFSDGVTPIPVATEIRTGIGLKFPSGQVRAAMQYFPTGTENQTNINADGTAQYAEGVHLPQGANFKGSAFKNNKQQPANTANNAFPLITFGYVEIPNPETLKELNDK